MHSNQLMQWICKQSFVHDRVAEGHHFSFSRGAYRIAMVGGSDRVPSCRSRRESSKESLDILHVGSLIAFVSPSAWRAPWQSEAVQPVHKGSGCWGDWNVPEPQTFGLIFVDLLYPFQKWVMICPVPWRIAQCIFEGQDLPTYPRFVFSQGKSTKSVPL